MYNVGMKISETKWFISNFFKKNALELVAFSVCSAILFFAVGDLLTNNIVAGWDTTAHFYIFSKMWELAKSGNVTGYDPNWFAGYPIFSFYGPLPYYLMALVHFATFGLLGSAFSFNFVLFLIPFLFIGSIFYTSRIYFGRMASLISLFFATMFLFANRDYAMYGIGIHSIVYLGLFANLMAISFSVFLIGNLEKLRVTSRVRYLVICGLLLGMIILTHSMTMIFTGIALGIFTLVHFRKFWKFFLGIMGIGLFVSSFWLVPFLVNLEFSSAYRMGVTDVGLADPLFVLFPKLEQLLSKFDFSLIPVLFSFILTFFGIHSLIRKKMIFWAYLFIFTLLFLTRDYFVNFLSTPLHYYRFIAHLAVVNIFVVTMGFIFCFEKISAFKFRLSFVLKGLLISLLAMSFLVKTVDFFNLRHDPSVYKHEVEINKYPEYLQAQEMMEFIASLKPEGRVAVQTSQNFQDRLGSPHYFSALLPLKYDVPVLPGLLAESALSTQYVLPVLTTLGNTFHWGNTTLLLDPYFNTQGPSEMIRRLGLYNVQYILTVQEKVPNLTLGGGVSVEKEIGDFVLLKLKNFKPLLEPIKYKPFLFVSVDGMEFNAFSKEWFKSLRLLDYPVIYTKKDWVKLSKKDQESVGGLVVSFPEKKELSLEEYKSWKNMKDKIVFLNAYPGFEMRDRDEETTYFIREFGVDKGTGELESALINFTEATKKDPQELKISSVKDEYLSFESEDGVIVNYSYFPRWKSKNPEQTVFWATPSMMFVFGEGKNELIYSY